MGATFGSISTWWSAYYADHQMVSLVIRYIHLAALMVGGGTALAIDRVVLASARARTDDRRRAAFMALRGSHRVVVPSLAVVTLSGILMTVADWTTFEVSRLFWIKMVLFLLLVLNGAALVGAERAFAKSGDLGLWRRLVAASGVSCVLWLLVLWVGEWLTTAA
jgi:uncharacterized membrane protein